MTGGCLMLIDVNELRQRQEPIQVAVDFGEAGLKVDNHISALGGPAHSDLVVALTGDELRVAGRVDVELELTCCRCLCRFQRPLQKRFDLKYLPDPVVEVEGEEFELSYKDLDIGFYRNDELDLMAVVSEQIVLEIPMKPICREECKGLCDLCGADLNQGSCSCSREVTDPRWQVLSELKTKLKN